MDFRKLSYIAAASILLTSLPKKAKAQTPVFGYIPPAPYNQPYSPLHNPNALALSSQFQQAEKLTLPIKTLEYGFYRTIIEGANRNVRGLEKMFKIIPATKGDFVPNNRQVTSWSVNRPGVYQLYAGGNDCDLELGTVHLNRGDIIRIVKVSPIIHGYSFPDESQPSFEGPLHTIQDNNQSIPQTPTFAPPPIPTPTPPQPQQ